MHSVTSERGCRNNNLNKMCNGTDAIQHIDMGLMVSIQIGPETDFKALKIIDNHLFVETRFRCEVMGRQMV
jgi:hypothetical protein